MFNVQTLVKTGDRAGRRTVFYSNIWRFISSYPEFFVLTTGKYIQSVTNSKRIACFSGDASAKTCTRMSIH
jgi:hypothetical protein